MDRRSDLVTRLLAKILSAHPKIRLRIAGHLPDKRAWLLEGAGRNVADEAAPALHRSCAPELSNTGERSC